MSMLYAAAFDKAGRGGDVAVGSFATEAIHQKVRACPVMFQKRK
jgi:hypothetical protein